MLVIFYRSAAIKNQHKSDNKHGVWNDNQVQGIESRQQSCKSEEYPPNPTLQGFFSCHFILVAHPFSQEYKISTQYEYGGNKVNYCYS